MTRQTLSPAAALREAARQMEHEAEFNVDRTLRWSEARQRENSRLINQSRELHERADRLERAERDALAAAEPDLAQRGLAWARANYPTEKVTP